MKCTRNTIDSNWNRTNDSRQAESVNSFCTIHTHSAIKNSINGNNIQHPTNASLMETDYFWTTSNEKNKNWKNESKSHWKKYDNPSAYTNNSIKTLIQIPEMNEKCSCASCIDEVYNDTFNANAIQLLPEKKHKYKLIHFRDFVCRLCSEYTYDDSQH